MLPLDFLRVVLARIVLFRIEMTCVCAPMIGMIARDPKRLQQCFQLQKYLVFAAAKDIRQDGSHAVINGIPAPSLLLFLADKTPHFVHLGFASTLNVYSNVVWIDRTQEGRVDGLESGFFLFE